MIFRHMIFRHFTRRIIFTVIIFLLIIVLFYNNQKRNHFISNNNKHQYNGRKYNELEYQLTSIASNVEAQEKVLIDIEGGNSRYDPQVKDLAELNKCHVCLGTDFCHAIQENQLILNTPFIRNGLLLTNY